MGFEIPEGESLAGLVLAASRDLLDPHFHQTLVYIAEHGPDGTLGLVMNRPLDKKLSEVALSPDLPKALEQIPVFQGGPVKTTALLFARFQRGKNDEQLSCQIVADPQELIELPKREWVRAFAGHAGWSAGQLERVFWGASSSIAVCGRHTSHEPSLNS